jgi:hypothetical protein
MLNVPDMLPKGFVDPVTGVEPTTGRELRPSSRCSISGALADCDQGRQEDEPART